MSEMQIPKVEKEDIVAPPIDSGGTAIVLQRHEKYERNRDAQNAGSIFEEQAEEARLRDEEFFQDVLGQETDGTETMILFVSSDTQYAGKGRRSLETAEIAEKAATSVLESMGIDPTERIINFNPDFKTKRNSETNQDIRPFSKLREPQIFDTPKYVNFLINKYGEMDGPGSGLSQEAWAAHEMDAEKEVREEMGAEGVNDMLDRTKKSVSIFERYARAFHSSHPNKRLVIWAATHYDTISPLVKNITGTSLEEYIPVDYGAGVVIEIPPVSKTEGATLRANNQIVALNLGKQAVK